MMRDKAGQALVEIAIVLPVLLLIIIGIIEIGQYTHVSLAVDHAAREGARVGALGGGDDAIRIRVLQSLTGIEEDAVDIEVLPNAGERVRGVALSVTVGCTHQFVSPIMRAVVGADTYVSRTTTMRVE